MEEFEAQCQEKTQNVKRSLEGQVAKYKEQVNGNSLDVKKE